MSVALLLLPIAGLALGLGISGIVNYCDPFTRPHSGLARWFERFTRKGQHD